MPNSFPFSTKNIHKAPCAITSLKTMLDEAWRGEWPSEVSGQAVQPVPLASLKLSMAVYGQKLDGRPSR